MLDRRRMMLWGGAAAAGFGLGLYSWRIEPHWVEFVRRTLPIDHLPRSLDGATLVQLSDLHVGPEVDSAYLVDVLQKTAVLDPEIVVFTGDFVTWGGWGTAAELSEVLAHFPSGRLATVAALGNHDSGRHWRSRRYAQEVTKRAADVGIDVLRNASVDVHGLHIVGLEDLWGPDFAPREVLRRVPAESASIVLSHNPDAVDLDVWEGYRGWILAGHTHGGQCKPPFLPPPLLPVKNRRYTAGEFDLGNGRRMYINRGVGHKERVRFNVRPEVSVFTLARG